MLSLCLRTDKPLAELYLYDSNKKLAELTWEAHRQLAETINLKIDEIMSCEGLTFADLEKICVYQGPGSFTGLRIGIAVANTLAYTQNIPIVSAEGEDWLEHCLADESLDQQQIVPKYGSEPHITKQKK